MHFFEIFDDFLGFARKKKGFWRRNEEIQVK